MSSKLTWMWAHCKDIEVFSRVYPPLNWYSSGYAYLWNVRIPYLRIIVVLSYIREYIIEEVVIIIIINSLILTFFTHASLKTFSQTTIPTLVAFILVHNAISGKSIKKKL